VLAAGASLLAASETFVATSEVAAASCGAIPKMVRAIKHAPAVFVGEVQDVRSRRRWATVAVREVWKGKVSERVEVRSGEFDAPGGLTTISSVDRFYDAGSTYLFVPFAREGDVFKDNACTRTTRYRDELQTFRPSGSSATPVYSSTSSPAEGTAGDAPHGHSGFPWTIAAVISIVLAGAAAYVAWVTLRPGSTH